MSAIPKRQKVVFELEQDDDGYPPVSREGLWAVPLDSGNFVLDNIPFFAVGVSAEDEVEVEDVGGEWIFRRLLKPSGISTFRLMLSSPETCESLRSELKAMGCRSEYNQHLGLVAVEIPATVSIHPFLEYIVAAKHGGYLDIEEGALRHSLS